ncbi:hypothetical protein QVD99_005548 [Batrachochytrium dendrobatidis]|nr:hypothetical protein QVD99_005548 [Batrachochytrium dendrobatidis]
MPLLYRSNGDRDVPTFEDMSGNSKKGKTDIRIHDAKLRQTSSGKDIIIIPHDDYNQTTISFFKTIGVKAQLYIDESKLEVEDESDLF